MVVHGGTTWVRLKCRNGHRPRSPAGRGEAFIGAAAGPAALNGTSGSRVSRSRTSSSGPEDAQAAYLADRGVPLGQLGQAGPDDVGAEPRAFSTMPSSSKMLIEATAGGAGQRMAQSR